MSGEAPGKRASEISDPDVTVHVIKLKRICKGFLDEIRGCDGQCERGHATVVWGIDDATWKVALSHLERVGVLFNSDADADRVCWNDMCSHHIIVDGRHRSRVLAMMKKQPSHARIRLNRSGSFEDSFQIYMRL